MERDKRKSDAGDIREETPDDVREEIPGSETKGHLQTDEHSGVEAITDMADYGLTEIEKIALGIHRLEFPETSEPGPVGDVAQPDTAAQPVKPDAAPVSDAARDTGLVGSQAEQSATEESSATD